MTFGRIHFGLFGLALVLCLPVAPAQAQATRTWVSGVGDDANPCSRTAPCKTFAGAISKTATAGEINVLDPGGFGAVTITKSITIANDGVGTAGVLVSGTNGIVVSGAGIIVHLRGLDIEGLGTGLAGVNFLAGAALHVERCTIHAFNAGAAAGIAFSPGSNANLYVVDTLISENGVGATGGGISIQPAAGGSAAATITRTHIDNNSRGIVVNGAGGAVALTVVDSFVSRNGSDGITAGANSLVMIDRSVLNYNGGTGVNANASGATALIGNSTIQQNIVGVAASGGGVVQSFKNNQISANGTDGTPLTAFPGPGGPLQ